MTLLTETSLEPFIALLKAQGLRSVLEVCCGPGDDGIRFVRAGIHYTGVDPFDGNVRYAVSRRLSVSVAEPASLPFADHVFRLSGRCRPWRGSPPTRRTASCVNWNAWPRQARQSPSSSPSPGQPDWVS